MDLNDPQVREVLLHGRRPDLAFHVMAAARIAQEANEQRLTAEALKEPTVPTDQLPSADDHQLERVCYE